MQQSQEAIKHAGDAASLLVVAGTLMELLPAIAAGFTIVWTVIRIWETNTVRAVVAYLSKRTKK